MDVARAPKKKTNRNLLIAAGVGGLIIVTVALNRLRPAAPTVEVATLLIDSVKKGDLSIEVRGPGNLVPEHIRWITAQTSARVERLIVQSGQSVAASGLLLVLSNPDVEIEALQAEQQLNQARSELFTMRTNLNSARLQEEGLVATTHTAWVGARQEAAAAESLAAKNLISQFDVNTKRAAAEEYETRLRVEKERLALMSATVDSQIAVQAQQVERLKAISDLKKFRVQSLQVRAPDAGIVQDLTLEPGQWTLEGTTLAKVVQPGKLKARIRIPETQAKDVQLGQPAEVDTRNGIVHGKVARKDPSSVNGTVTVDISLDDPLPPGAVPDLSVDGTIKIAQLKNVFYTGCPSRRPGARCRTRS